MLRDKPDHAVEVRSKLLDPWRLCRDLNLTVGYKPTRQAKGLMIRCPVHADRTPSCSVTLAPDGGIRVKCHGCDFSGDALTLIAVANNLDIQRDFRAVLEIGAQLAGITLTDMNPSNSLGGRLPTPVAKTPASKKELGEKKPSRPIQQVEKPPSFTSWESFQKVANWLLGQCPLDGPIAVGLLSRGILQQALEDGWGELPVNIQLKGEQQAEGVEEFEQEDLALQRLCERLRENFHEAELTWLMSGRQIRWPEHRLMIPWRDPDGVIVELQRRYSPHSPDDKCPARTPKYVFPSTSAYEPVGHYPYGVDHKDCERAETIWIVEGAVDVLALRALNAIREKPASMVALGIAGVERWETVSDTFRHLAKGRRIRVALDADRAGESKVHSIVEAMFRAGAVEVTRPRPPAGVKDWGELAAKTLWYEETAEMRQRRLQQLRK